MTLIRRACFALILIFLTGTPVLGADVQRYEIFGGFAHLNTDIGDFNGFGASWTTNFNDWFSLVSDYSGHFGTAGVFFTSITNTDVDRWYFLMGPQFNARKDKLNFFGRIMIGAARSSYEAIPSANSGGQVQEARFSQFALGVGVGVDVHVAKHFGLRLIQADWIRQFGDNSSDHWDLRLGTGVLVKF